MSYLSKRFNIKILRQFIPLFILAGFLPFFLFFIANNPNIRFTSQADQVNTLRIWFEPSDVLAPPGSSIKVNVMAEVSGSQSLLSNLTADLVPSDSMSITPSRVVHNEPFTGRILLQTVEIIVPKSGIFIVNIPQDKVLANDRKVETKTSPLNLSIRPHTL